MNMPEWIKTVLGDYGYLGIAAVCFAIGGWLIWKGLRTPRLSEKLSIGVLGLVFVSGGFAALTTRPDFF